MIEPFSTRRWGSELLDPCYGGNQAEPTLRHDFPTGQPQMIKLFSTFCRGSELIDLCYGGNLLKSTSRRNHLRLLAASYRHGFPTKPQQMFSHHHCGGNLLKTMDERFKLIYT
jgi:hypothetical protein